MTKPKTDPRFFGLPEECPETLEHCFLHLSNAMEEIKNENLDQLLHEVNMSYQILNNVIERKKDD